MRSLAEIKERSDTAHLMIAKFGADGEKTVCYQSMEDIPSLITTIESQKEEIERMRYCLNSIANRHIGVFGEGFGYDFHYKNLRDSAKKCLSSLSQEGEK